tara:strand:- start:56 stop:325 length:270 start_codon:yes stop_codon:yes gene_type:complete
VLLFVEESRGYPGGIKVTKKGAEERIAQNVLRPALPEKCIENPMYSVDICFLSRGWWAVGDALLTTLAGSFAGQITQIAQSWKAGARIS